MTRLRITYKKSAIGYTERQKATVRALGFRRLNETIEHEDTPAIRGMIDKVSHLVTASNLTFYDELTAREFDAFLDLFSQVVKMHILTEEAVKMLK